MCDKELLVSYLYDEVEGAERKTYERHLETCGDCRNELQALQGTRKPLASWVPAEPDLGFAIVRGVSRTEPARFRLSPAWGFAAAAVLVLAVASAIANLDVRLGAEGVAIRTGWASRTTVEGDRASADALHNVNASRADIASLLLRVRDLETAIAAQAGAPAAGTVRAASGAAAGERMSEAEFLRRVDQLIAERVGRTEQALARRVVAGMQEMLATHQDDIVRLQQTFNQSQGVLNDEVFRQREELKQFYRVVGSQAQR